MPILSGNVFFPPENSGCNVNIDLKSYATKAELKAVTGVDTSAFAKSTDLTKIKESVGKLEKSVPLIRDSVLHLDTKVKKNSADYGSFKTKIDNNTKNYSDLKIKVDNIKPETGDYVKKTDYDKDKRDELALRKDLEEYALERELNTNISTFLSSSDPSNPLRLYVDRLHFNGLTATFLRSPGSRNPLNEYAKKTYVDDKIKNIKGGGSVDLSGYVKQTDFNTYKDRMKKELSALMGRSFFNGVDGLLNEHIYAPKIKTLKFHSEGGGKVEEWKSVGENPVVLKSAGYKLAPIVDVNDNSFEMRFNGHRLSYGATSKFNSTVTNVYLVYKLNLYKNVDLPKYPLLNALFGAIKVDKKGSTDPEKWVFTGKGIAIDSDGSYGMGPQGLGRNVILFGVDNTNSKHPVNRPHHFMVLGNGNTQLVENVNSIPEKGLAINMTYPGKKFVLSIHYSGTNSLFYVNGILMTVFSDKYYPDKKDHIGFNLGNFSTDFTEAEETEMGLRGNVYEFSVDHKIIKIEDIKNIHAYLMKKHNVDNNFPTDTKKLFH